MSLDNITPKKIHISLNDYLQKNYEINFKHLETICDYLIILISLQIFIYGKKMNVSMHI